MNLHYSAPKQRERSTKLYRPSNAELIQIYSYTMYAEKADISVTTLLMIPVRSSLQNKKKPEADTHTSKCCHIEALQFSSIQFSSVQFKKTVIIPQGAILLWSWWTGKIIIHKVKKTIQQTQHHQQKNLTLTIV